MHQPYHGDKDTKFRIDVYISPIRKHQLVPPLLFGIVQHCYLLGSDGQDGNLDAVELVETSP